MVLGIFDLKKGIGTLKSPYKHYFFSKGLNHWISKHLKYAEDEVANEKKTSLKSINFALLLNGTTHEKRRILKAISYKIPCRPLIKFIYMYFFKKGFLDGVVGLRFCIMKAIYEQIILLKKFEEKRKA